MAVVPAAVLTALLGWLLLIGSRFDQSRSEDDGLAVFSPELETLPKPVRIVPARHRVHRRRGEAAPPNLRSNATELVAPEPVVLPIQPPPMIVAPVAGLGMQASQGAAQVPGPGTGAGGHGNGTGSGGSGDGDGDGLDTAPRRIKGKITDRDWPPGAGDAGEGGVVSVRYYVEVDGRATGCRITHSSGSVALDETTCRLIEQRFRYRPSLDADGRPVRSIIVVDHEWVNELSLADREAARR
ncbi:protein TonB [Sphingomonas aerophila]|uniref:Protein TonB n=1 Tax=Sphingomonas aerophila TaxID=1344948 RepID=A0A7W9EV23_9SPHN|nr:protein TonB [Sphingomonas aerophila]